MVITYVAVAGANVLLGTGLLTRSLCDVLIGRSDVIVEYVITDVSSALANSAVKTVSYDRAFSKAFDLSRPKQEQGFDAYSFDIVAGLRVLHAVPDIAEALASLRTLLVPGGSLLVVELDGTRWEKVPGALWHDTIFGSFAEWFGSTDGRNHPSLSPGQWAEALGKAGFEDYQSSVEGDDGTEFLFTAKVSHLPDHAIYQLRAGVLVIHIWPGDGSPTGDLRSRRHKPIGIVDPGQGRNRWKLYYGIGEQSGERIHELGGPYRYLPPSFRSRPPKGGSVGAP